MDLSNQLTWPRNLISRFFHIPLEPVCQPDECSCGLSCLKMVLACHGRSFFHDDLNELTPPNPDIGLYDSHLGLAAIQLGFAATIYTYNYRIFHPIWNRLSRKDLMGKLATRQMCAMTPQQALAAELYIEFLRAGGELLFYPLSRELILAHFNRDLPLIAALDMSFLYDCMAFYDEFSEHRATHFVVLHGYNPEDNTFFISDPWYSIPLPNKNGQYYIDADRVINAIFLGQERNDSAIIVIQKKKG